MKSEAVVVVLMSFLEMCGQYKLLPSLVVPADA